MHFDIPLVLCVIYIIKEMSNYSFAIIRTDIQQHQCSLTAPKLKEACFICHSRCELNQEEFNY